MLDFAGFDAILVQYLGGFLGFEPGSIAFPIIRVSMFIMMGLIIYFGIKKTVVSVVKKMIIKKEWKFGSYLIKHELFTNALKIIPIAILLQTSDKIGNEILSSITTLIGELAMIVIIGKLIMSLLNAFLDIMQHKKSKNKVPVKTLVQVFKIIVFVACAVSIIAKLTGKDPLTFLSGLAGLSAIFMLIMKDSLLGIVAGIQISAYGIMERGDWVSIPSLDIDGEVQDISLNTITIANWDNTLTILPAHKVLSEKVINWSNMLGNGRRIKESIFIDINTVRFLTNIEIKNLKKINILRPYLEKKEVELKEGNVDIEDNEYSRINGRALSNIGTFRAYTKAYLDNHKDIAKNQTLLVRKRSTKETGVPVEIYAFSTNTSWSAYEEISSSIFEHLYSVIDIFGLKQFQNPTGEDFRNIESK